MAKRKYIAKAPIRALMSESGAKIVSGDAVNFLLEYLTEQSIELTKKALQIARHGNRKKINAQDIKLAVGL